MYANVFKKSSNGHPVPKWMTNERMNESMNEWTNERTKANKTIYKICRACFLKKFRIVLAFLYILLMPLSMLLSFSLSSKCVEMSLLLPLLSISHSRILLFSHTHQITRPFSALALHHTVPSHICVHSKHKQQRVWRKIPFYNQQNEFSSVERKQNAWEAQKN